MFARSRVAALVAEFVGTAVLASAVLAMAGRTTFPFFGAIVAGLVMGLMMMVISPVSGAHLNPIVTIGLWTVRKIETAQALVYVAAQMLGGLVAWQMSEFLLNQPLRNIAGDRLDWRVLLAEAIGAFVFTFALASAVTRVYEGARLAFVAGAGLTLGMIVASLASNGLINPAVAVGLQSWGWAYVLGPVAGSLVGMNLYGLLYAPLDTIKTVKKTGVTSKLLKKSGLSRKKK